MYPRNHKITALRSYHAPKRIIDPKTRAIMQPRIRRLATNRMRNQVTAL